MTASIPFLKMSSGMFSLGECMAFDSSPKPIRTVFMPKIFSKVDMIGMLPPRLTGNGRLPNAFSKARSAALYAGMSIGQT